MHILQKTPERDIWLMKGGVANQLNKVLTTLYVKLLPSRRYAS